MALLNLGTSLDIQGTCDRIVANFDAILADTTGTAIEQMVRTIAECAASVQTLADMVKTLAEAATRG